MNFIDWCSHVLSTLVQGVQKSGNVRSGRLDTVRLFKSLFGEETPWDSQERKSMNGALTALETVDLIEGVSTNFPKVTIVGRQLGSDLKPLWKQICSEELQPDQRNVLSIVNRLSQQDEPTFAHLKAIHHDVLLAELNPSRDELREGSDLDFIWTVSEDLAALGLVKRDARIGPHLYLTATYRGLVWETRRRLFQKCDVFISHITEEKDVAEKLKSFLLLTFGEDLKVFVSSDYRSIPGGRIWYQEIVESLKAAPVVLVVLSEKSVERRWINFEAGTGIGSGSLVIPLVTEGFPKSSVGLPLSVLQVRALSDSADVEGLIADIGERTQRIAAEVTAVEFAFSASASDGPK